MGFSFSFHPYHSAFSCDSNYTIHDENTMTCLVVPMSLINIAGFPPLTGVQTTPFLASWWSKIVTAAVDDACGGNCVKRGM
jgi:hypothetical protein